MKIFATALFAIRRDDNNALGISVLPGVTMAADEAEAQATADKAVRDAFPESEHWEGHTATLTEIEENAAFGPHRLVWQIEEREAESATDTTQEGV